MCEIIGYCFNKVNKLKVLNICDYYNFNINFKFEKLKIINLKLLRQKIYRA